MSRPSPARSGSRRRCDRGSASVELLIILPALFAVMLLGMQAALFYYARTVAIAAAQEGARAAAVETGSLDDGVTTASGFVADAGGDDVLLTVSVTGQRTATVATITVRGRSLSVLPGWTPVVRQSASMPVERLTVP